MADNKTKLAIAKEITEVFYRNVRLGIITPEEGAEIIEALSRTFKRTNELFKASGNEDFITEGVPPVDPKDWS